MIDTYKTEEEQIEAIKKWWKKDGLTTVALVCAIGAGYFGWQHYQASQVQAAQARSAQYQTALDALLVESADDAANQSLAAALESVLAGDDGYRVYGLLLQAKTAVEAGDLEQAKQLLQSVVAADIAAPITDIAKLRLARVYYALGEYDAALAQLNFEDTEAWNLDSYELQGDIFTAQQAYDQAVVAFEKAATVSEGSYRARYIDMKLNQAKAAQALVASNE